MKNIDNKLIEAEFEKRWKIYPVKIGRIDALKYWKADIKSNHITTINEFNEFLKLFDQAESNYISYIKRCWSTNYNRRFKDGSTFFYNWRDFIEPPDKKPDTEKPNKVSEPKSKPVKRMYNKDGSPMSMRQIIEASDDPRALKIYDELQEKKQRKARARPSLDVEKLK